jgi:hypothetical protein
MSSSQGATTGATGIAIGYAYDADVRRDASDWTRQLKEQRAFRSYSTLNTGNKNTGTEPWLKYGNQFRYTYLFGKFKCGSCPAGAFNGGANGVVGGS